MINEVIVTTVNEDGKPHIAPMGIHVDSDHFKVAPYKPSTTLENMLRERTATINYTTDVRIFAGALTGHRDWPMKETEIISGYRLSDALGHAEIRVTEVEDDEVRPCFHCESIYEEASKPFTGFNRAQAAVIELAILVSRLDRLPAEKIDNEIEYLSIAIEKTAGENERTAWSWLIEKIENHRNQQE